MARRVVVTAMGIVTRFGGTQETLEGVFAGHSAIGPLPSEFNLCPTRIGSYIAELGLEQWFEPREAKRIAARSTRPTQFSHAAIKQALDQAGLLGGDGKLPEELRERTGLSVGSGIGASELISKLAVQMDRTEQAEGEEHQRLFQELVREHLATAMIVLPDASAFQPTIVFGMQGPLDCSVKACATGAGNIRRAALEIREEFADVMVAGGTESLAPVDVMAFDVYAKNGALSRRNEEPDLASRPFDQDHDGFVPGEGACVLVLEEREHAIGRGARILAELVGFGETSDAKGATDPDQRSQVRAMRMALGMAGLEPGQIRIGKTHGTSTPSGDGSELTAIKEVFGRMRELFVYAPKSVLGHTLGASGAIESALLIEAMNRGVVPPTRNLERPIPEALICDEAHEHGENCFLTIARTATEADLPYGFANSFGFGGQNVTLLFERGQS